MPVKKNVIRDTSLDGMTASEKYQYIYDLAKSMGDKFPELTAAQFALESADGTSDHVKNYNNPFGQTATESQDYQTNGKGGRKWRVYDSIKESVKDHVTKWAPKYKDAKNAIEAIAIIQPNYAPSSDNNPNYIKGIASKLKREGYYEGDINLPNADNPDAPDFYKYNKYDATQNKFLTDPKYGEKLDADYDAKRKVIDANPNKVQRKKQLDELNREFDNYNKFNKNSNHKSRIFGEYVKEYDQIIQSNKSDEVKANEIAELYEDINTNGLTEQWNAYAQNKTRANTRNVEEFKNGTSAGGLVHKLIQQNVEKGKTIKGDKGEFEITISDGELKQLQKTLTPEQLKELNISQPKIYKGGSYGMGGSTGTNGAVVVGNTKKFLEIADKEYRNLTGNNLYMDVEGIGYNGVLAHDVKVKKDLKVSTNFDNVSIVPNIDKTKVVDRNVAAIAEKEKAKAEKEALIKQDEINNPPSTEVKPEIDNKANNEKASDYFDNFNRETIDVPDYFQYEEKNFKKELPLEALAFGALALKGLADAETEIPLRTDDLDEAVYQMASELKKLSEIGLKPEEEAKMRDIVTSNYSQAMDQLTRASGGNRNLVLGNASTMNMNRLRGLADISLADIQRKDAMRKEYNETVKYIDQFHRGKNMDNHNIKMEEAKAKRIAGASLAASGFSSMIDELQYQKENGPGSVNHMAKQSALYKINGYVPGMKGGVNTPGTYEYMIQQNLNIQNENNRVNTFIKQKQERKLMYERMTPEKQQQFIQNDGFNKWKEEDLKYWDDTPQLNAPKSNTVYDTLQYLNPQTQVDNAEIDPYTKYFNTLNS